MEMLTTTEVATLLGVSQSTIWRLIDEGALPSVRLSETSWHRVTRPQLTEYAKQKGIELDWSLIKKQ